MSTGLVAYFSASGRTAKVAVKLAGIADADLYEIRPAVPYTKSDLNWMNKKSRSSVEMNDRSFRPAIVTGDAELSAYQVIYLGFPIWWYTAPTVINTFLETYDFAGKKIILFATSGGSKFGGTVAGLQPSAPGATFLEGAVLNGIVTEKKLREVAELGR